MSSSTSAAKERLIVLKSSDGETFEVEESVASKSQTIKHMLEDDVIDTGIPVPNVKSKTLAKVLEYCKRHVEADKRIAADGGDKITDADLKEFNAKFVNVDQGMLFDLILAANYLDIKGLLDLTCQTVANTMKGKSPEEIRKMYNIKNDFTPEEEAEIRKENAWAFE
ncbi:hypothetical protein ACJIZ3_025548 [Penstemon smallii]|uniref:SKP1-like protein n=1 Tax=Penstemon smallii TaxID=265156 RepID=A0ABD3TVY9_9LAMI